MIIDDLTQIPREFKEGIRAILLLFRTKDGEEGNAQRKAIKKISRNADEWDKIVTEFADLKYGTEQYKNHRIYSSVNPRNMTKAMHEFKLRQVSVDYGTEDELHWFYVDLQNRFFSCLMKPNCRAESNFLIDCDIEEEYEIALSLLPKEFILFDYPTRSGRHIICKPFNPNVIRLEVKKDALMLIG